MGKEVIKGGPNKGGVSHGAFIGSSKKDAIREGIRNAVLKGLVNEEGKLYDGAITVGYVVAINIEDYYNNYGTVDVQEYNVESTDIKEQGLHKGVLFSAYSDFEGSAYMIPRMFSEVAVVKDSITGTEYVLSMSLVDTIHFESGQKMEFGVKERDPYDPNGDGPIELMEYGKKKAWVEITDDKIVTVVQNRNREENTARIEIDPDSLSMGIHHNAFVKIYDGQIDILTNQGDACITLVDDNIEVETGGSVYVKSKGDVTIDTNNDVTINSANNVSIYSDNSVTINSNSCEVKSKIVTITGGMLEVDGAVTPNPQMLGGFCAVPVCPLTGAVHVGKQILNT